MTMNDFEGGSEFVPGSAPHITQGPDLAGLAEASAPYLFGTLQHRLIRTEERSSSMFGSGGKVFLRTIDGFDDVVGEPLGSGLIYNHSGGSYQLAFALSLAPNPAVGELVQDRSLEAGDIVAQLRALNVL